MQKSVPIQLSSSTTLPAYLQIAGQIEEYIRSGHLVGGEKLPSVRKLTRQLDVSMSTVLHAYDELSRRGHVVSVKGSGVFVREKSEKANTILPYEITPDTINLASTSPDLSIYPMKEFGGIFTEILQTGGAQAFAYQESRGYYPLRQQLSGTLSGHGILASAEDIIVVSGAQQGIDTIAMAYAGEESTIFVENPGYTGAKSVFSRLGLQMVGIHMEKDGMDMEQLKKMAALYRPALVYVTPRFQTPTTICYSKQKMQLLLTLSKQFGFYIIEDDEMSDIDFGGRPLSLKQMDSDDRVIYIKSFSKILMPGLRIACIAAPSGLCAKIAAAKHTSDISSPGLFQRALELYLSRGHMPGHVQSVTAFYQKRLRQSADMLKSLAAFDVQFAVPTGGLNFWLSLPAHITGSSLYHQAARHNVLTAPGELYYTSPLSGHDRHLRLCYAMASEAEFETAVGVLKRVLGNNKKGITSIAAPFI